MSNSSILTLNHSDNIAVALRQIDAGVSLGSSGLFTADKIPSGHKVAMTGVGAGQEIKKYG